jgi:class 3 adenylate cyclase
VEHRTVAILSADIAGYGRLLERDPEGTVNAIAALQKQVIDPLLGAGRVFRLLGDGSLYEFPTAASAVAFAIALQRIMRSPGTSLVSAGEPLRMRMGVHCGDIVSDGGDIHGESVTVAVRLEAMAPEGGFCISGAVHASLEGPIQAAFSPLGPRLLKNIEAPIAVWRWVAPEGASRVTPGRVQAGTSNGRQVLDPRVTDLLLELHMRSARLAVSDAIDEILCDPGAGRGLSVDGLYQRIGAKLNPARDLLNGIGAQCLDDGSSYTADKEQMNFGKFIAHVFDNARTAFAFRLLPQIVEVLDSDRAAAVRRCAVMSLIETFMVDEMLPRVRALIDFAFIDP